MRIAAWPFDGLSYASYTMCRTHRGFGSETGGAERDKLHKTIIFGTQLTGQYHFFNFLLKSTSFGAWRYKLDLYPSNHNFDSRSDQRDLFVNVELAAHVEMELTWTWSPLVSPLKK
jgi:hypothetical protein